MVTSTRVSRWEQLRERTLKDPVARERYEQTRRTFCTQAATFAVVGGALGTILQGCSSPTSPGSVPSLSAVSGTRVSGGVTL